MTCDSGRPQWSIVDSRKVRDKFFNQHLKPRPLFFVKILWARTQIMTSSLPARSCNIETWWPVMYWAWQSGPISSDLLLCRLLGPQLFFVIFYQIYPSHWASSARSLFFNFCLDNLPFSRRITCGNRYTTYIITDYANGYIEDSVLWTPSIFFYIFPQ